MLGVASSSMRAGSGREKESRRERHEVISMYTEAPTIEITLDEFELFALDRLMVLRKIEDLKARGFRPAEMKERLGRALAQYMRINSLSDNLDEDLRKDLVSHFILRLAYCRTEDLRRWFLAQESALFKYRLESLPAASLASFIASNGLNFAVVGGDEKSARRSLLLSVPNTLAAEFERTVYYRIPFAQAADLVGQRLVYVEAGFAYVPLQRVVASVVSRFRSTLSRSLVEASAAFAHVAGDPRFGPLLQNMNKQYTGKEYGGATGNGEGIKPGDIDELSQRSMPLCMRTLHTGLQKDHKLKHWGRLQYGLYLKGVGLSMEDALVFWETAFSKLVTTDQFQKQYAYSFRHMYGKEGKRTNYTPYSCIKIIMSAAPGAGEHHGCPYRHYDEGRLSALLGQLKLGVADKDAMMGHVRGKNYQLACQHHFEATHKGYEAEGVNAEGVGNHPNAWTAASMSYYKAKNKASQPTNNTAGASASGDVAMEEETPADVDMAEEI